MVVSLGVPIFRVFQVIKMYMKLHNFFLSDISGGATHFIKTDV